MSETISLAPVPQLDGLTLRRIQWLHPALRNEATMIYARIATALAGRAVCRFSSTLRTAEEQEALYARGRTLPGPKVTNARGGHSYHNYGLAIDIVLLVDTQEAGLYETPSWETSLRFDDAHRSHWQPIVSAFKAYGWEWGGAGSLAGMPHFQKILGYSIARLQQLQAAGAFLPGGSYLAL
ncbi:MAG TPA: M15 family metallopeptidase [Chitinophagaceae bacterium]|jgi:peptidoglycan L-alanyl-D-glutamate endopeptidase CwlK|nr:M15 family metallopeptidase [Chitinophagaceae bacterium]